MAGSAGRPVIGGEASTATQPIPFDEVLCSAQQRERLRLRRYRRRWIAQQAAVLLVAAVVLVLTLPVLIGIDNGLGGIPAVVVFLSGGWLGYLALMAAVSGAVMAMAMALGRTIGVVRADDLAAYERVHAPWWVKGAR